MNPLHVRHIREALQREFRDRIDLEDIKYLPEAAQEPKFLSRALAALAIRHLVGSESSEAGASVIDGEDDCGIDAVAVTEAPPRLWLVQSKWSAQGNAGLDQASALKMRNGLDFLLNTDFAQFNARFQAMAHRVDAVLGDPDVEIRLVIALLGRPTLADPVQRVFDDIVRAAPMASVQVLGLLEFHDVVRLGIADPKINLSARLESCGQLQEPYQAYYGTMAAGEIAEWYSCYGNRLFAQNIRKSLGLTPVNRGMIETLVEAPEHFWYFNNGITVLCDTLIRTARHVTTPGGPGDFSLAGATVVNGAQTVAGIHAAMEKSPEIAARGRVWVRLISLDHCPENFATDVTQATNTQNQVEPRDFVALDPNQARLRDDFSLSLHKTYVLKRGDIDPAPEAGCSVVEAARALACANRDPDLAMRAKQSPELLWEQAPNRAYQVLFRRQPGAYRVWRAVQVLRSVLIRLEATKTGREGRAAQIADYGEFLIAHCVFRQLSGEPIDDPAHSWDEVLERVDDLTDQCTDWLIHYVDDSYGQSYVLTTFKSPQRCRVLADKVNSSMRGEQPRPILPSQYRPAEAEAAERRTNAVTVIINSARIAEGAPLEFRPGTGPERMALAPWLAEDPRRGRATWVRSRSKPLLWAGDGKRYSPSGLAKHMMIAASGRSPKAIQGTSRWFIPGEGSLVQIANKVRRESERGDDLLSDLSDASDNEEDSSDLSG